ncbi:hypothetical protein [Erythrobacter sp. MTPC3]|uniref:hypothetical protein n=1 Tax=Erythrobacter sp. MTPC3 TaxID=3056564 RepID=UPI0036F3DA24
MIEAASLADLLNIGGQLQFRFPDGGTCECHWVEVDTYKAVSSDLPWKERVEETAATARLQFQGLLDRVDFIAEGRTAFKKHFDAFEAKGGKVNDAMCFVWYMKAERDNSKLA